MIISIFANASDVYHIFFSFLDKKEGSFASASLPFWVILSELYFSHPMYLLFGCFIFRFLLPVFLVHLYNPLTVIGQMHIPRTFRSHGIPL